MKRSSTHARTTALIKQWQDHVKPSHQSEMMRVAEVLLAEAASPDWEDEEMELRTRAALGFAKASCHFTGSAKTLLESCASEILKKKASKTWWAMWEYIVFAELVKCCNSLRLEQTGEEWAKLALSGPPELASCAEVQYIQIALADSFIGQQRYGDAQQLLSSMSQESPLSDYLAVITILRLNKVRRRLNDQAALLSDQSIITWDRVFKSAGSSRTLKLEAIEELVSTVVQSDHSAVSSAQRLVAVAIHNTIDDPDMQNTRQWQLLKRQEKELELRQTAWSSNQSLDEIFGTQGPLLLGKTDSGSKHRTAGDDPLDVVVRTEAPLARIPSAANSTIAEDQKPPREDKARVHYMCADASGRLAEKDGPSASPPQDLHPPVAHEVLETSLDSECHTVRLSGLPSSVKSDDIKN